MAFITLSNIDYSYCKYTFHHFNFGGNNSKRSKKFGNRRPLLCLGNHQTALFAFRFHSGNFVFSPLYFWCVCKVHVPFHWREMCFPELPVFRKTLTSLCTFASSILEHEGLSVCVCLFVCPSVCLSNISTRHLLTT